MEDKKLVPQRSETKTDTKPNSSSILDDFGSSLQQLIQKTLEQKSNELKEREECVSLREQKVDTIMKNNHIKGRVELRVGSLIFHTTADILLSRPGSYFHGLLNIKFREGSEQALFIARDGESFKFVLEYLTYGKLFSIPTDLGTAEKLCADADFYLLPELYKLAGEAKEQLLKFPLQRNPDQHGAMIWMRVASSAACGNGGYINWNSSVVVPPSHFSHSGNTTTIQRAGLYHIFLRYEFACSTNGQGAANVDLYIDGAVVARSYHGKADGYYDGRSLEHLDNLKKGAKIQVLYRSNSNCNNNADALATTLTILCLSSE